MKAAKKTNTKPVRAKAYSIAADSKCGFILPDELMRAAHVRPGDEFIAWTTGKKIVVVFPKRYKGELKIPKTAQRGKLGDLPDESQSIPPGKSGVAIRKMSEKEIWERIESLGDKHPSLTPAEMRAAIREGRK